MATSRDDNDGPHSGANFLVDIGEVDPWSAAGGFSEVIFTPFLPERPPSGSTDGAGAETHAASGPADARRLILRRGATGRLDLYRWWNATRRTAAPPTRTVTVQLLADDHRTVVLTWRFLGAHPVSLSYSPLRAVSDAVVMESLEISFERVEMA